MRLSRNGRRRCVITGLGPITCIGKGRENFWRGILAERSIADSGLCLSDFAVLEALLHQGPLTISEIQAKVLLAELRDDRGGGQEIEQEETAKRA